jgi:hypothetical protein
MAFSMSVSAAFAQTTKGESPMPTGPGGVPKASVSVRDVKFLQTKLNNQVNPWNRMQVELQANFNPDPKALNKRWVDKIKVTVTQIYKTASKDPKDWNYYRASATVLTMEVNQPRSVVFYLPGDIVKRDNLRKEPDWYYAELSVGGAEEQMFDAKGSLLAEHSNAVHKSLSKKSDFDAAKDAADRGVGANPGILRPQYLVTLLYPDAPVVPPSPEFIREDAPSR